MSIRVCGGGIIEKDGKYLLVQEQKEVCKGKWNIPSGGLEGNESVMDTAKREIFEESGCKVELTGVIDIINGIYEGVNVLAFVFDTKIIEDNIVANGKEISNVKWFTFDEIKKMKNDLRNDGYLLGIIKNKIDGKILPMDIINRSEI